MRVEDIHIYACVLVCVSQFLCASHWKRQLQHELGFGGIDVKIVVKRTVMTKQVRFFSTMFSTSGHTYHMSKPNGKPPITRTPTSRPSNQCATKCSPHPVAQRWLDSPPTNAWALAPTPQTNTQYIYSKQKHPHKICDPNNTPYHTNIPASPISYIPQSKHTHTTGITLGKPPILGYWNLNTQTLKHIPPTNTTLY